MYTLAGSFDPILMKLSECYSLKNQVQNLKLVFFWIKTRSLGQILEKKLDVHSGRHKFDPICLKLCQNVNLKSRSSIKLGHDG